MSLLRRSSAMLLLLGVIVALGVAGPVKESPASSAAPSRLTWLAAGDSFSSGQGLPHATGACAQAGLGSGSVTWPDVAYQDLGGSSSRFAQPDLVACTGATTSNFMTAPDNAGAPEWDPSMGRFDLVTFTFGGDDIGFRPILEQCLGLARLVTTVENTSADVGTGADRVAPLPSDPGHTCPSASIIDTRIAAFGSSYRSFLGAIANEVVVPGGNIVVLGYPDLIELPEFWANWEKAIGACWGIGTGDATELRGMAGDLNATIGAAVAAENELAPNGVHMTFVDVNSGQPDSPTHIPLSDPSLFEPSPGTRHNLCSADSWINGPTVTGSLNLVSHSFHPNQAGNDNMGGLAKNAIAKLDWSRLHPPGSSPASTAVVPTLGANWPTNGGGFGEVEPSNVYNGGDGTSAVTGITWKSWGGPQAVGDGMSEYIPPNAASAADGSQQSVTIVAFNLGNCGGVPAYTSVEWYFPEYGGSFIPDQGESICTNPFNTPTPEPTTSPAPAASSCPSPAQVYAAWVASPGIETATPGSVTGFAGIQCWENWVVATVVGNGNGVFFFSQTGGLHGLSASESSDFMSAVCSDPSAPTSWKGPNVVDCPS
jgi:hypothetical protein